MIKIFVILLSIASAQAQELCELNHISGYKKAADLSEEAIKAACATYNENKCKPEVEEIEPELNLDPARLADSLIRRDKAGKNLLTDLFKRASNEDKTLSQGKLESLMKAKIVEFVKVRNCEPAFGESSVSQDYDDVGGKLTFKDNYGKKKALETLEKRMSDPIYKKAFKEKQEAENKKDFYAFFENKTIQDDRRHSVVKFCAKELVFKSKGSTVGENPTCVGSVSKYFEDNFAELKPESEEARLKDQQAITKCITDTKAAGYEPESVTINSSANKLKNTATIKEIQEGRGYCGFDFLSLSTARAEFAKNKILPELLPISSSIPVTLNPRGTDGNGASGECPYNAKGAIKAEFTGAGQKKLDQYKSTEIIVKFKPTKNNTSAPSLRQFARIGSNCSAIRIKCKGEP